MQKSNGRLKASDYVLGIQHLFAMFGATVLVPLVTGFNPALALVSAGIGTLIFHVCTKFKVPVFLGSSFAFIAPVATIVATQGIPAAQGGIIVAGALYIVFALIAFLIGPDRIKRIFPPVVTGPVIIVIGLGLSYAAINDSLGLVRVFDVSDAGAFSSTLNFDIKSLLISLFVVIVVVCVSVFLKGFFRLIPILFGIIAGYILCVILNLAGLFTMDFSPVADAPWVNIPYVSEGFFTLPSFSWTAILTIAPVAIVTFMEHIGDITTNGTVVGQNFFNDPGLHRTLLGDGIATAFAGFIGGPANTTYSENTGVLATTKNYNPKILRLTAVFAIILGLFGKFGAILQTIPAPVKGGVEIVLFGMIASIGIRTLADADLDFTHSRNLIIVALILVVGLGINIATYDPLNFTTTGVSVSFGKIDMSFSGLFIAVIVGVLANLLLPLRVEE
ncbi:MAG: uracil-xanthine permease family protein [Oscillospiraceae bacterium]|nr:uracil-xanthine permease family protein [Oscillospiraceae bacterium]